jgi:hypothetical protein
LLKPYYSLVLKKKLNGHLVVVVDFPEQTFWANDVQEYTANLEEYTTKDK